MFNQKINYLSSMPQHTERSFFQAKLNVNEPGDAYEQEADAVADKVMRMTDPSVSSPINKVSISSLQRKCAACEEEDKMHRKEASNTGGSMSAPPIVSDVLSGSGKPLDKGTQQFMESRMGQDFSNVRIHTDGKAAESAQSVNALAYTSGHNIVFNNGQYQPDTEGGKRLLAHELVHVGQQRGNMNNRIDRKCFTGGTWKKEYDGCSVPAFLANFAGIDQNNPAGGIDTDFGTHTVDVSKNLPCDYHDECYQTCGMSKSACDMLMYQRMLKVCANSKVKDSSVKLACFDWAKKYYFGLAAFGDVAYLQRQSQVCTCKSTNNLSIIFSKFAKMLRTLDEQLKGNATQSWGMIIYGNGDGRDSTATKASKDAHIFGSFDYKTFMEYIDLILTAIPENTNYHKTLENMREELNAKEVDKVAGFIFKLSKEIEEIKEERKSSEPKKNSQNNPIKQHVIADKVEEKPHKENKVQIGQWITSDNSGNTFVMIKYSDGSKKFSMGSMFGIRDISDPGITEWEKVKK